MSLGLNILLILFSVARIGFRRHRTGVGQPAWIADRPDETEDARGKRVAQIARDPNTFLSTVQIGVTLSGFLSASFGESSISPYIVPIVESWGAHDERRPLP